MTQVFKENTRATPKQNWLAQALKLFFSQLLLPGLALIRSGKFIIGWILISFALLSWFALLVIALIAISDRLMVVTWLTTTAFLDGLIVLFGFWVAVSLASWALTVKSTWKLRYSKKSFFILISSVTVALVLQLSTQAYAITSVLSQKSLLQSVFVESSPETAPQEPTASPEINTSNLRLVNGRVNVLLLGGDAGAGRWGLRPDSISVVSINPESGDTTIIGVPRNLQNAQFVGGSPLYGPFPTGYDCGQACLISYLYTYGAGHSSLYPDSTNPGISAMQDVVQGSLGIEIPYVVLIDMAGFSSLVDSLGGVTVCVPQETLAQDMATVFHSGCQHMSGQQALLYSRTRYDSNDYGRMAKQRLVQQALLDQIQPMTLLTKFQSIASHGGEYVSTNIPQDQVASFVELGLKMKGKPVTTVELVPPVIDVTAPDFTVINQMVTEALH